VWLIKTRIIIDNKLGFDKLVTSVVNKAHATAMLIRYFRYKGDILMLFNRFIVSGQPMFQYCLHV